MPSPALPSPRTRAGREHRPLRAADSRLGGRAPFREQPDQVLTGTLDPGGTIFAVGARHSQRPWGWPRRFYAWATRDLQRSERSVIDAPPVTLLGWRTCARWGALKYIELSRNNRQGSAS